MTSFGSAAPPPPVWVTPTFAAGDFTANGSMTWTVAEGDVVAHRYMVWGTTMFHQINLTLSTVGGTPNTQLILAIPGGYTVSGSASPSGAVHITDNSANGPGLAIAGGSTILFFTGDNTNWTASTNATNIRSQLILEIIP